MALAIDPNYNYPAKYRSELDFYDMIYDVNKLYDPNIIFVNDLKNVTMHVDSHINKLSNDIEVQFENLNRYLRNT